MPDLGEDPVITPPPVIARDTSDPAFIGYWTWPGDTHYSPWSCIPPQTWCVSSGYGGCAYERSQCQPWTTCSDGTIAVGSYNTITCTLSIWPVCVTDRVYDSPDGSLKATMIACGAAEFSIYRQTLGTAPRITLSSKTGSFTPITPIVSLPVSSISASPTAMPSPSSQSKAWIAGPVLGGIATLIGLAIAILLIRRGKQDLNRPLPPVQGAPTYPQQQQSIHSSTVQPSPMEYIHDSAPPLQQPQNGALNTGVGLHPAAHQSGHVNYMLPREGVAEAEGSFVRPIGAVEIGPNKTT